MWKIENRENMNLPQGWTMCNLTSFCSIRTGKFDANHAVNDGKYRFYTCSTTYSFCDTKSFEGECVIIPGNGEIGQVYYYDGEFEAYQRTYVLEKINILPRYLYYHLFWNWRHTNSDKQYGSTVRYIRIGNFEKYVVFLPPLLEQQRIVAKIDSLFSELDNGVTLLKTIKAQLAVYRQAVLKWAFEGKLTNSKILKVENLKNFIENPRYGTSKKCAFENFGTKVYRIPNIDYHNGMILQDDLKYAEFSETEKESLKLKKDDILIIRSNGSVNLVGRASIIRDIDIDGIFAGYLMRLRITNENLFPKYLLYYFSSPNARLYIEATAKSTSGVNNINSEEICRLQLPYFDMSEQLAIVSAIESRLSVCEKLEQTIDQTLALFTSLRQSILKKAFEGRLVPPACRQAGKTQTMNRRKNYWNG